MKLQKFKEKDRKKTTIVIFTIFCILLIIGTFFLRSFALYEEKKNFNVINGNIIDSGDLYFAYYIDGKMTFEPPKKTNEYRLSKQTNCTNNVTLTWDYGVWKANLDFSSFEQNNSKTRCDVYFESLSVGPAVAKIINLEKTTDELIYDDTPENNLRYVGKKPNNYVNFNGELWRIIGVFHDVEEEDETINSKLKLVRNESIGKLSWAKTSNSNNWATADIMKLMNPGYESQAANNSLYWDKKSGQCYNSFYNNSTITCDYSTIGLTDESKTLIDSVSWGVGGSSGTLNNAYNYYINEHNNIVYKNNAKKWIGKVGLMNPSDYGFATSGGATTSRENCLAMNLNNWNKECIENNWLTPKTNSKIWTMHHTTNNSAYAYIITQTRGIEISMPLCAADHDYAINNPEEIFPSIYLRSSVEIIDGDGTEGNPYQIRDTNWKNQDTVKPIAKISATRNGQQITIDASKSIDNIGIKNYYYSTNGESWIKSTEKTHQFNEELDFSEKKGTDLIKSLETQKIKKIYVKVEDAAGNMSEIVSQSVHELLKDETEAKNIRYVGASPNNYVDFNGEKWRIIGVMNNIDDGNGNKEQRIKIVRDESIGEFSYDTSNTDNGKNNWLQSDLVKLINPGYESETVGGSLYWNRTSGTCYNGINNAKTNCDFSTNGLTTEAKNYIDQAIWNLGGSHMEYQYDETPLNYYNHQQGSIISEGNATSWTGYVGLIYPSDYGFSTTGDSNTTREDCLSKAMGSWNYKTEACGSNSWLKREYPKFLWTMQHRSYEPEYVNIILSNGSISYTYEECSAIPNETTSKAGSVRPVVYLKNSVKIISGTGTKKDSFQLSLN